MLKNRGLNVDIVTTIFFSLVLLPTKMPTVFDLLVTRCYTLAPGVLTTLKTIVSSLISAMTSFRHFFLLSLFAVLSLLLVRFYSSHFRQNLWLIYLTSILKRFVFFLFFITLLSTFCSCSY